MATSTPPPASGEPSYTAMATADVESIGAHCQMPLCRQLDFLPFRCDSCHSTYCLDHRTETAHSCPKAGEWARNRRLQNATQTSHLPATQKPTLNTAKQCSEPACKTFINTSQNLGVHCENCNRHYCLKHRFREEHDCKNLVPLGARPIDVQFANNAEKIRDGFAKLRTWGQRKTSSLTPSPKPTSKAAQVAAVNTLKRTAKGDDKIPQEKRLYLHVEAEAASITSKIPKAELFFNEEWTVGRVLDEAAKRLQVSNVNNRVDKEEERLRIYHVEGGRVLEFGERLGKVSMSGNTVVLLRGIGPYAPSVRTR